MPTVSVGRDRLFEAIGRTYSDEEFEELCNDFGLELDDVKAIVRKEKHLEQALTEDEEVIYKIEVAANRYDLLCLEGLAQALRVFLGIDRIPKYELRSISGGESMLKMHVKPEKSLERPYAVCAVLRGITLDQARYNSLIDLQDRLHQNVCRRRTLVSIGIHDLDKIDSPLTYESELKPDNSSVYPVIYDRNRAVLSSSPTTDGAYSAITPRTNSAITPRTKNVLIECTASDLTKANVVLNTMVTMFSTYCERKFEIEPVEVIDSDGRSHVYPDLSLHQMEVPHSYITDILGVPLEDDKVASLLNKMQLHAVKSLSEDKRCTFTVSVPPTRSDILHPCDVAEDVAIAYGYNEILKRITESLNPLPLNQFSDLIRSEVHEIPKRIPASLNPSPLNQFSDLIRSEIAMCGYTEVLNFVLSSCKENFAMLNRRDDKSTAVIIGNPRSSDSEVVRASLMPGMLKTIGHNKDHPKPIKIFEVGDIVLLDETKDVGAANHCNLAALYCGATSGFELIHGLVDKVMEAVGCQFVQPGDTAGYYVECADEPEFLRGAQASIIYKGKHIGTFGIVHPEVLNNFDIRDPCSYLELNIESFLKSQVP